MRELTKPFHHLVTIWVAGNIWDKYVSAILILCLKALKLNYLDLDLANIYL